MRSMPAAFAPDGDDIPDAAAAMAPGHLLRLGGGARVPTTTNAT
jgi:hypothetical protein